MIHLTRVQISEPAPIQSFIDSGVLPKDGDHMIVSVKHDPLYHYIEFLVAYTGQPTDAAIQKGVEPFILLTAKQQLEKPS